MSLKRTLFKNAGFNLTGYIYLLVVSFFSIPLLLSYLGRDLFGIYIFLASFIPLASVFDFGVSTAVVRHLSLPNITKEEKLKVWQTSLSIFLVLAAIVFLVLSVLLLFLVNHMAIFKGVDPNTLRWSILVVATIAFVNHLNTHFLALPQSEQRFDVFNLKTYLVGTANTLLSTGVAYFYPNLAIIFTLQLFFHLATLLLLLNYSQKVFRPLNLSFRFNFQFGGKLLHFGFRSFIGTLAGQVENQLSSLILGAVSTATAITAFNIPQSLVSKASGVVSQFAQAFFPLSASLLSKEKINKLKVMVLSAETFILLAGLLTTFLIYRFGEAFLLLWLKDPVVVSLAYPVLRVLAWYFVLVSLTPLPTALCQGLNKPQVSSFFGVLTVTIEVINSLLLVRTYQSLGIAYAFLSSVIITVPTFLVVTWVLLQTEIKRTQSLV